MRENLFNWAKLLKFNLKKEAINTIIWLVVVFALIISTAMAFNNMFSTQEELMAMAGFFDNPAMIAMMGKLYAKELASIATIYTASMLIFIAIISAVMNIFFVIRTTRADEERGRVELILSLPVGRLAPLHSTMISVAIINAMLTLVTMISLSIANLNGSNLAGILVFSLSVGVIGLFFASATAIFCQLFSSSRTASTFSIALLGLLYILRAIGDIQSEFLSLISPLGLILRTNAHINNNILPLIITLIITLLLSTLAYHLNSIRDLEQGLIPQKKGKSSASPLLKKPIGLALTLLKPAIISWAVALAIMSMAYGSILGDIESFITGNEFFNQILIPPEGHTKTEMFLTMIIAVMTIAVTIPATMPLHRLANEEKNHRYHNILSKAVSRKQILFGYFILAISLSVFMQLLTMLSMWIACVNVMQTPISFFAMLSSFMVYLPAIWIIIALSVLLFGIIPSKSAVICNAYLGYSFAIIYLGEMLSFPNWLKLTSPFGYIPKLPMDSVNPLTITLLIVVFAIITTLGYLSYDKRDII